MKKDLESNHQIRVAKRKLKEMNRNQQEQKQKILESQHLEQSTRFMDIVRKQQCRRLNHQLMEFHRRNFVNNEQESKVFKEQWQNKKTVEAEQDLQIITYQGPLQILLAAITMISFTLTIWLSNVQFFFGKNRQSFLSSLVYLIPTLIFITDLVYNGKLQQLFVLKPMKTIIIRLFKPGICLLFLILKTISVPFSQNQEWLILELPCLYILYCRAIQFYKSFRVMSLSKKYEYHFKAFDLIFSLIMVAHIIAIILFLVAQNGPKLNWMTHLQIDGENALIQYIYSFYFGCTTILTVGYGDITPKNHLQIGVVCLIEIFGIAIFAYLISQIGYNLGTLRKDREIVEKDLSILEKCRSYYKIEPQLIVKARSNLLNNKEAVNRLKPEEEKMLVMKLGEPLRQEVMINNSLSVLKSCIFFLCRWSKQLQRTLSQCLVSALYSPGQQLFQPLGNERIYIIRLGKIDFYRKQRGNKQEAQKMIKSMTIDLNRQVSDNFFGYTAVIGSKPTVLEVISRDFTSAYYIDKENFTKCVNQTPIDFEYYHEIKDKIQQNRLPEAFEVPALNNRKYHFNPPRTCVIKRENKQTRILKNERSLYDRIDRERNGKKEIVRSRLLNHTVVAQVREALTKSMEEIDLGEETEHQSKTSLEMNAEQKKIVGNTVIQMGQLLAGTLKCPTVSESIGFRQQGKQYQNYYPSQNLQIILQRYDRNIPLGVNKRLLKVSKFSDSYGYKNTVSL